MNRGKVSRPASRSRYQGGCDEMPETPMGSAIRCSSWSGCRATCQPGNQFPNGETTIRIRCVDGVWKPSAPYEEIPDCARE